MEKTKIFGMESDLDWYHGQALLEIEDPKEREQAKELYESFFKPFYQYMERKYVDLERRMEQKYYGADNAFTIVTGICQRSKLPLYEEDLFPMCLEDKEEKILQVSKMQEDIAKNGKSLC